MTDHKLPSLAWRRVAPLLAVCFVAAAGQITVTKPNPAKVTVHVASTGSVRIADTVFGSFLEPIGNSINNGIAAEILVNRSLEAGLWNHVNLENLYREQPELVETSNQTGIPLPWQSLNTGAGNRFELHVGQAANSWQSLEVIGQPDELTGIMQKVYLPVQRVLGYKVSFYARHISGSNGITVSFRDRSTGKVLAQSRTDAGSLEWTRYTTTLHLPPGAVQRLQAVNFGVAVEGAERVELDQISLLPEDAIGTLDPDAVAMAKAMHITELRFGGNFSSYYHWRDGIGSEDKRVTIENIAWGIPEYNNFGTDEFLQLCDLIGAIPQFNLNMGSGTPEEAADWVRYIHAHHKGRVLYEIGNELWGKWQVGYPTLQEIGPRTLAFSKAVRAVDPHAEIIATGDVPHDGNDRWNQTLLNLPAGTFEDLSLHLVMGMNHPLLPSATPDFTAEAAYASAIGMGNFLDRAKEGLNLHADARGKVHFAVTEWLFNSKGYGERNFTNETPSWMNEGGAVLAAAFLNQVLRRSDSVTITDMTGLMEFAGIWKRREQVYAVPAYYAFQMYTVVKGDTVLPVITDSGTYNVRRGLHSLETLDNVPYVDVVATRSEDGKTLTLLCVNRSLEEDVSTDFDLSAFRVSGPAKAKQISAASRYEQNSEVEPNHVVPQDSSLAVRGSQLSMSLAKESVTVLRLPLQ
ncbi:MAG: alpha-L-arabinofuranosidase C-terminal domain-containing protein [Janthinobacterium lividum]